MAANTQPVFPKNGNISWSTLTTANTALDGTGTVVTLFTANATNGSRVDTVKVKYSGTSVATVLRIFINNGSSNTTATNNTLYVEQTIAANTLSQVAASTDIEISIDLFLPASYKLIATIGTTIANAIAVTVVGGDY